MGFDFEHPAEAWTTDEDTPFTLATQGVDCRGASQMSMRWVPTGGTFTSISMNPQLWRPESGWEDAETDGNTDDITIHAGAHTAKTVRVALKDAHRCGWRANNEAGGGTTANKYTTIVYDE